MVIGDAPFFPVLMGRKRAIQVLEEVHRLHDDRMVRCQRGIDSQLEFQMFFHRPQHCLLNSKLGQMQSIEKRLYLNHETPYRNCRYRPFGVNIVSNEYFTHASTFI